MGLFVRHKWGSIGNAGLYSTHRIGGKGGCGCFSGIGLVILAALAIVILLPGRSEGKESEDSAALPERSVMQEEELQNPYFDYAPLAVGKKETVKDKAPAYRIARSDSEEMHTFPKGEIVTVVSQSPQTGWSEVEYLGTTMYMESKYLQAEQKTEQKTDQKTVQKSSPKPVNATMYATQDTKLKSQASANSSDLGTILKDAGIYVVSSDAATGYSECTYNGKTYYVLTKYLTLSAPQAQEPVRQQEPTKQIASDPSIGVISYTKSVEAGSNGSITIKGVPGVEYDIDVHTSSKISDAGGLDNKVADANGNVTWKWKVGSRSKPGTYIINIYPVGNFSERITLEYTIYE